MSHSISPTEAIEMIPGWDVAQVTISEFPGGLSNRSYLVARGEDEYFLRLNADQQGIFGPDRENELAVMQNVCAAGLGPEVVFGDAPRGVLLCRRLPGRVLEGTDLDDERCLAEVCRLLRKVHRLPESGLRFSPSEAAATYVSGLQSHHGLHAFALYCEEVIAGIGAPAEVCCCHNDTVAGNFIVTPDLKLIDWEYTCDNDPMFDLASLIGYHDLSIEQARFMLHEYDGNDDRWAQLQDQCRLYDAVQWLWLANRQVRNHNKGDARRLEILQRRIDGVQGQV